MQPLIQLKRATSLLIILSFVRLGLLPNASAVSPAPDGGYPGGNTAEGQAALLHLTTGGFNTAVGFLSLSSNTTNNFNTAVGAGALLVNTADANTATGAGALLSNTTGTENMANGEFALLTNTTGNGNTANGSGALQSNTIGSGNTANGNLALYSNTTGIYNTATGVLALTSNTTADNNTAIGYQALSSNIEGLQNTAIGFNALFANTSGSNNIALGTDAGQNTTGDYNIDIGNAGVAIDSNTIRIGDDTHQSATFLAGVYGASVAGLAVVMDSSDHLGTTPSSRRFKSEIKPMENASETILALQPVTFRYKTEIDPAGTSQFGLVAEDVEKVNPDLVVCDKEGKPYSVRYDAVNAMLLNEFLKEHKKVEEQHATIAELKSTVAQQQKRFESKLAKQEKQIEALTTGLQKVSAQLEMSKPAPQTVLNDQ